MTTVAKTLGKGSRTAIQTPSRRTFLGSLLGVTLLAGPTAAGATGVVRETRFLFGSPVELLVSPTSGRPVAPGIADAMTLLERINNRWNAWKPGEVTELNAAIRSGRSAAVSSAMVRMIRAAEKLERASSGFFNAGIGGAVQAWGFHCDQLLPGMRPRADTVLQWCAARPSLSQITIRGNDLYSRNPHLQLDFGAYAKGVAIDLALDRLQAQGVTDAVLNLGGNLAAMGRTGQRAWRIGIRAPVGDGLIASLETRRREAVVTSGSYERFRMLDGQRFGHILDPYFAAPTSSLVSVTVLHARAGLADAAATALLVAGPRRWRGVAERMGVDEVMVVDGNLRGEVTPRLAQRLRFASAAWRASFVVT